MTPDAPDLPVWLLDVDGVVNALPHGHVAGVWHVDAWVQRSVRADVPGLGPMTLSVLAAAPVLDFVAGVVTARRAEIRWHSTWRQAAASDLAPALGLPAIPVADAPEWQQATASADGRWTLAPGPGWWKLPAARRVVADGRRLIWTDDHLAAAGAHLGGLAGRADVLLLAPDPRAGLAPGELARIDAFLSG